MKGANNIISRFWKLPVQTKLFKSERLYAWGFGWIAVICAHGDEYKGYATTQSAACAEALRRFEEASK